MLSLRKLLLSLAPLLALSFQGVPMTNYSKTFEKLVNHNGHHNIFTTVFIISTFANSKEFDTNLGHTDYVEMLRALRQTWAAEIKHFYMLTGDGQVERRVLANTNLCQNLTNHYIKEVAHIDPHAREQVYNCNGIKVLHMPYCDLVKDTNDDKFHGCRCEAAMRYHLNKAILYPHYPKWFYMADDDYYLRLHKLEGIVSHLDPLKPYTASWGTMPWPNGNGKRATRLTHQSFGMVSRNCTVPCAHKSAWYGSVILSIGGLRLMENEIRARGLSYATRAWNVYHDVSIGIFLWQQSIPFIAIPKCNAGDDCFNDGTILLLIIVYRCYDYQ